MRNTFFASIALGISTLALASCGDEPEIVDESPEGIPGLTVENARLVLNAVEGNPAALYFDISYEGDRPIMVSSVFIEGAESAMLHDFMEYDFKVQMVEASKFNVPDGETVKLEPGGLHVMAMNPSPELAPGGTTEVTVTIAGGDKMSFPVEIKAAGDEG